MLAGFSVAPRAFANCSPSLGGDHIVNSNCAFTGSVNGVDNGNITVNAGVTLTVNANQTIAWNAGKSITVNGTIALSASGAQLKQTNLWIKDADNDGYSLNSTDMLAQDAQPSSYQRRSTRSEAGDCNDSSASTWQYLTGYPDGDGDAYTTGSAQSVCSGSSLPSGYSASSSGTDCDDTSSSVYQNVPVEWDWDEDQDGYTYTPSASPVGSVCVGAPSYAGGRTYYRIKGGNYLLTWSQRLTFTAIGNVYDCNDTNASVAADRYVDNDGDGYGSATIACVSVGAGSPYVTTGGDCSDANANIYQNQSVATDGDQDGYSMSGAASACVGSVTTVSGRTYYKNSSGSYNQIAQGSIINTNDCYDSNANAKPGQTAYYSTNRGDGSFDYNCDSVATKSETATNYYCTASLSTTPFGTTGKQSDGGSCSPNVGFLYCPSENIGGTFDANAVACGNSFPGPLVVAPTGWRFYNGDVDCNVGLIGRYGVNTTVQTCR